MQDQYPEIVIQLMVSILIGLMIVVFIVIFFQLYQKKKLVQEREMESLKASYQKELLQTRLEIQEDVMKRISMEIHDNIGQVMLLANVNLSILQTSTAIQENIELITDTKQILSRASEDISQLSRSLNSDRITDLGVLRSIKQELKLYAAKGIFKVELTDPDDLSGSDLPKETQLLVFRMFQEITNNIIKHANAGLVQFSIEKGDSAIHLEIIDDGIGFDYQSTETTSSKYQGVGLRSLQSRAAFFNGKVTIQSILQKGTTINIFIPNNTPS